MQEIVLDMEALLLAAARIGVFGRENVTTYLRMEITEPASLALLAAVITKLHVNVADVVKTAGAASMSSVTLSDRGNS